MRARYLRHDMAGRAKTVNADSPRIARHDQRAPADQAGAEQWRERGILAVFAQRKTIAGVGDKEGGKTAIARVAGEFRVIAEIFLI